MGPQTPLSFENGTSIEADEPGRGERDDYVARAKLIAAQRGKRGAAWPSDAIPWNRGGGAGVGVVRSSDRQASRAELGLPANRFVGREADLRAIVELLSGHKVVSITGLPGVGKSRLALEAMYVMAPRFQGGVFFVELGRITDHRLVLGLIAEKAGLQELPGVSMFDVLKQAFAVRPTLVVLDNCEHVLPIGSTLAALSGACSGMRILATSFSALGVRAERSYPLDPLAVPGREHSAGDVAKATSVSLFVARARDSAPAFAVNDENASAVTELCRRAGGLPLALELAASWMRVLTPAQYLERMDEIEKTPQPVVIGRHASLRDAIYASYSLLGPQERKLFRTLSVFRGGSDLAGIEAVASEPGLAFDQLRGLYDVRLLSRHDPEAGPPRFSQLPPLQRFGLTQLASTSELDDAQLRHAYHFARLARQAAPELLRGDQMRWIATLELEHDNLRAALDVLQRGSNAALAAETASALTRFWYVHGHLQEGRTRLESLIQTGDSSLEPWTSALVGAGLLAREQGDYPAARAHLGVAEEQYRATAAHGPLATVLYHRGILESRDGDVETARVLFSTSLRLATGAGDSWTAASAWRGCSHVARASRDLDAAMAALERSLALFRNVDDPRGFAISSRFAGEIAIDTGAFDLARGYLTDCLELLPALRDAWSVNNALLAVARLCGRQRDGVQALTLVGAAQALRVRIGAPLPAGDWARVHHEISEAVESLSGAEKQRWNERGARMTMQEAVAFAVDLLDREPRNI